MRFLKDYDFKILGILCCVYCFFAYVATKTIEIKIVDDKIFMSGVSGGRSFFLSLGMFFSREDLIPNVTFKTSRSGGKGGQNVNKVSSKVELNFDLDGSTVFTEQQKEQIRRKLQNRLTSAGMVQVISEEERSQYLNKEICLEKLLQLLEKVLHVAKPRRATRPSKSSIEKRLNEKQQKSVKKLNRKKGGFDF